VIDYAKLKARNFPDVVQSCTAKDTMLYALGLGYGHDPMDENQLQFVYEKNLKALPTMPVVLGYPGFWIKEEDSGIDWVRLVHGEQSLTVHKPLPVAGTVIGRTSIKALVDKGAGKGALVVQERKLFDKATGDLLATLDHLTFCRADGGFSDKAGNGPKGGDAPPPAKPAVPETRPDAVCDLGTLPQAALIYRLCADDNPLHAEPAVATAAGFPQPILHGLATYGVAGHAILKTYCSYDPAKLRSLSVRFSAPVFPGETIRTEMWKSGDRVQFRAKSVERDIVVLSHGTADIS
jgi:acyl dehydratase